MKTYVFETETTMKEYNCKKWWIANDFVRRFKTDAESLQDALEEFRNYVWDNSCISISDNAMRTKSPMYIDAKDGETIQCGYVFTGLCDFQDDNGKWSKQYIDLWVRMYTIENIDFAA